MKTNPTSFAVNITDAKRVLEPPERQTGGLRDAHDVPAVGHRVTERVDAPERVQRGSVGRREDHA